MSENDASGENTSGAVSSVDLSCSAMRASCSITQHINVKADVKTLGSALSVRCVTGQKKAARSATTRMNFKGMETKAVALEGCQGARLFPRSHIYIYTYIFV